MLKYQLVISLLLLTLASCDQNRSSGLEYYQEMYHNLLLTKEISKDIDDKVRKIYLVRGGSCSSCASSDIFNMLNKYKPELFIYIGDSMDLNFTTVPHKTKFHIVSIDYANSNGFLTAEELIIEVKNKQFETFKLID